MKKKFQYYLLTLCTLFLLPACEGGRTVYHTYQSLPLSGWQQNDTLTFDLQLPAPTTPFQCKIGIRYRDNYPYTNLPLAVSLVKEDSLHQTVLQTYILHLQPADTTGTIKGKGWGGLYELTSPPDTLPVTDAGSYHLNITHLLSDSLLQGIRDIGVQITE
jgi:gliding motility-associated lipoprotein GldH